MKNSTTWGLWLSLLIAGVTGTLGAATTVDVMIAYDQSASAWLAADGRTPQEFAQMAVTQMNSVLPNTELDQSFVFRLVGTHVSAAEASGSTSNERVIGAIKSVCDGTSGKATGLWQDVQTARDRLKADLVAVLIDAKRAPGYSFSGISWQLGAQGNGANVAKFAPFAYSVVSIADVEGRDTLIHEVGHNMGAGHSSLLVEDPGPQEYPYSQAYHFSDGNGAKYHTIMGYQHTTSDDTGYEAIPCFSSATHCWKGIVLGDALHDNTRTLRETCTEVAKFRLAGNESGVGGEVEAVFAAKIKVNAGAYDALGRLFGLLQMTVAKTDKKGFSKVSGTFIGLDGKKKSVKAAKATVVAGESGAWVRDVKLEIKGLSDQIRVSVGEDGTVSGTIGTVYTIRTVSGIGRTASVSPRFTVTDVPCELDGFPVYAYLLPEGMGVGIDASGSKWKLAKAAKVKLARDSETGAVSLQTIGADNLCALKLSVSAATGVMKGSFVVYAKAGTADRPKLKKYKFTVSGLVAEGVGTGVAVCRKPSVSVAVEVK